MRGSKRVPRRRSAGQTHISVLPAEMLSRIFAMCTDSHAKAAILATCRAWRQVASADPAFWDVLVLNGTKLQGSVLAHKAAGKKAFLAWLAGLPCTQLKVLTGTANFGAFLPAALRCLRGGPVGELSVELGAVRTYEPLPPRTTQLILKEVLALRTLRSLSISEGYHSTHLDFSWSTLAPVSLLTCLESLSLSGALEGSPPPALFAPLARLTALSLQQDSGFLSPVAPLLEGASTGLQRLELCAFTLDLPACQLASRWGALRDLVLRSVKVPEGGGGGGAAGFNGGAGMGGVMQAGAMPAGAGAAAGAELGGGAGGMAIAAHGGFAQVEGQGQGQGAGGMGVSEEGEEDLETGIAWAAIPHLTALTGLTVVAGLFAPLRARAVAALARSPSVQSLRLGRYSESLLPELSPGALPALTRLRLSVAPDLLTLPASWCAALATSLQVLEVENCYRLALPGELSMLRALCRLGVNHQRLEQVPRAVLTLTGLTRLSLCANTLQALAPGPYLSGLRELVLFANAFRRVPPELVLATRLQLLDLTMNWDLELGSNQEDFDVLRALAPTLLRLLLRRWPGGGEGSWCRTAPGVERRLRRLLPHTEVVL